MTPRMPWCSGPLGSAFAWRSGHTGEAQWGLHGKEELAGALLNSGQQAGPSRPRSLYVWRGVPMGRAKGKKRGSGRKTGGRPTAAKRKSKGRRVKSSLRGPGEGKKTRTDGKSVKPKPPPRDEDSRKKASRRKYELIQRLSRAKSGRISIGEYAAKWDIDDSTIRRFGDQFERMGLVQVSEGEIRRLFKPWAGTPIGHRLGERHAEKKCIGEAIAGDLAELRRGADAVLYAAMVGSGSACYHVSRALAADDTMANLTIITPSLLIADLLGHGQMTLKLAGGTFHRPDAAFQGDECVEALKLYRPDVSVVGFSGLDGDDGSLWCTHSEEVDILQTLLICPQLRVCFPCDTLAKIQRRDNCRFGSIEDLRERGVDVWIYYPQSDETGPQAEGSGQPPAVDYLDTLEERLGIMQCPVKVQ